MGGFSVVVVAFAHTNPRKLHQLTGGLDPFQQVHTAVYITLGYYGGRPCELYTSDLPNERQLIGENGDTGIDREKLNTR